MLSFHIPAQSDRWSKAICPLRYKQIGVVHLRLSLFSASTSSDAQTDSIQKQNRLHRFFKTYTDSPLAKHSTYGLL